MLELKLKPEAQKDLIKIFEYTEMSWGLDQAEKYQDELYEGMQLLLVQENLGKIYPHSDRSYRKLHINRHLIFYRVENQECLVVRILHDRIDIDNHLGKEKSDI